MSSRIRKMLKERHDVGEGLMERLHVDVADGIEQRPQAIEQAMGRFVRDDVLRQARKHDGSRRVERIADVDGEVTEEQRPLLRAVVRVAIAQRMRIDPYCGFVSDGGSPS